MADQPAVKKPVKALMVCAMGMSSSLLEIKTKEAAAKAGVPFELRAVGVQEVTVWDPKTNPVDIILIAPQIFYKRAAIQTLAGHYGILVQPIEPTVFGMVDGDKLFEQIMKAISARDEAKAKVDEKAKADEKAIADVKAMADEKVKADEKAKVDVKATAKADDKAKAQADEKEKAKVTDKK